MSITASVTAVDSSTYPQTLADAWFVQGDCPRGGFTPEGCIGFYLKRHEGDVPPLAIGDQITVPVHGVDGHVLHGDARLKMIGWPGDPNTVGNPFPGTGWRNPLTGVTE